MRNLREVDYHYKACDLNSKDELERRRYEYLNEYGCNIDCSKRRMINSDVESAMTKRFGNGFYSKGKK